MHFIYVLAYFIYGNTKSRTALYKTYSVKYKFCLIFTLDSDMLTCEEGQTMNISKFVKMKITEREINQAVLAQRAGFKNQSNVAMMLKVNNMRLNNVFSLLDALDCELVIRDKITGEEKVITAE